MDSRYYDEPGTFAAEDAPTTDTNESTQDALADSSPLYFAPDTDEPRTLEQMAEARRAFLAEQEPPFDGQLRPLPADDELRAFLCEDAGEETIGTRKAMAQGAAAGAWIMYRETGEQAHLDAMKHFLANVRSLEGLLTEREAVRG